MKNNPIGILDSGVGGFTIMEAIFNELPKESLVSVADSGNTPYGGKSKDFIVDRSLKLVEYLINEHHAKLIALACNTITVTALDTIRQTYPETPVVGVVPVIKTAAAMTNNKKIGVLSTTTTAQSTYQKDLIDKFAHECDVLNLGTDALVPLIESGKLQDQTTAAVLRAVLVPFQEKGIDTLALGCTHFPLLRKQMAEILGEEIQLLDSGGAVARQVRRVLEHNNLLSEDTPSYQIFTSGDTMIAKNILNATIEQKQFIVKPLPI